VLPQAFAGDDAGIDTMALYGGDAVRPPSPVPLEELGFEDWEFEESTDDEDLSGDDGGTVTDSDGDEEGEVEGDGGYAAIQLSSAASPGLTLKDRSSDDIDGEAPGGRGGRPGSGGFMMLDCMPRFDMSLAVHADKRVQHSDESSSSTTGAACLLSGAGAASALTSSAHCGRGDGVPPAPAKDVFGERYASAVVKGEALDFSNDTPAQGGAAAVQDSEDPKDKGMRNNCMLSAAPEQ
jgi:hypothetical protein